MNKRAVVVSMRPWVFHALGHSKRRLDYASPTALAVLKAKLKASLWFKFT